MANCAMRLAGVLLTLTLLSPAARAQGKYVPVGVGGGGSMYEPASSPHEAKLMFVSCDMGGLYRSEDGGASWTMLDFRNIHGSTQCRPAFHPTKPNVIWFGAKISEDAGKTWKDIPGAPFKGGVTRIAFGDQGRMIVVGLADGAFMSRDEGKTWQKCEGVAGKVVGIAVLPFGPDGCILVGTERGVFRSGDRGNTWVEKPAPGGESLRSFAVGVSRGGIMTVSMRDGTDKAKAIEQWRLFCTVPSKSVNGTLQGGIFTSDDFGDTWQSAMGDGLNVSLGKKDEWGSSDVPQYGRIEAAAGRVYVVARGTGYWPPYQDTIYRSDDAGKTWRPTMFYDVRFTKAMTPDYTGAMERNVELGWISHALSWMWAGIPGPNGLHVNERNADVAMATNSGELYVTTDGGKLWRQVYTKYAPGQPPATPDPEAPDRRPGFWQSIGLEVTTCWNYRIDPHNHKNHFICYTDIGLMRSEDGGLTWTHSGKGNPWENTCYDLVFDPERKGRAWAAMSNVHDIPHWTYVHEEVKGPGGVCVSDDGGKSWKPSTVGLPTAPITSIALDQTSPAGNRTLWCTAYGQGVFKSVDDGKSWTPASAGIDLKTNSHAFLVERHPSGALFCTVTATRGPGRGGNTYSVPGALYRSADGGATWTDLTAKNPIYWPTGFAVNPKDANTIYLAAHTATRREDGGIYKTTDGGASWTRRLRNEDFAGKGGPGWATSMFVTLDPNDPRTLYMGTDGHGLWISRDGAKSWKQLEGMPFGSVHRVTFDPDDANLVYITTFGGGVWRGPRP